MFVYFKCYISKINISEGIDVNKTNVSNESDICHCTGIPYVIALSFSQMFAIDVMIY